MPKAIDNASLQFNEIDLKAQAKKSKNTGFGKNKVVLPKTIPSPVKVYTSNIGRSRANNLAWEVPQWDLAETGRILDCESYVRRAFRNKKNLWLKEGYSFVGPNPDRVKYIKKRIKQMEMATNMPFEILISQTIWSLIRQHNAFWVKARKTEASGGKVRTTKDNKKLNPVAGYFLLPAETVRFKRDEYGKIKKYSQELYGKELKEFNPEDVIHFYLDKREGYAVGTPTLVSVKDDIRALRRIEENVELLVYNHLFPLFHYQVGTELNPAATYPDGSTEVDTVAARVRQIPADGCFVTSERHKIEAVGASGSVASVEKIIEHFKQRIFTGLGNSSVDMGEGGTSNRCFDKQTQILTSNGWKYYWEYDKDSLVGTISQDTHKFEFQKPIGGLLSFDYEGELYKIKNRHVDLVVTPNHKLYLGRMGWKNKTTWELREVQDVNVGSFRLLTSPSGTNYSDKITFDLPQVNYKPQITKHSNLGPFNNINADDWLEFLGYFISEGTLAKVKDKWAISISQSQRVNPEKVDKIRSVLQRLPFKFNEYYNESDDCVRFWINCKSLWSYLANNVGTYSDNKKIPKEFMSLSDRQSKILINALVLGDGSFDNRENRKGFVYYSSSAELLDNVQELGIRAGFRVAIGPVHQGVSRLNFHPSTSIECRTHKIEKVFYKDKVWAFEVPNHVLIVRRNGKVSIQGNSTAQQMSRNLIDDTKADQREFATQLQAFVVQELLLESTFSDLTVLDEENAVNLHFREIDLEARNAKENHSGDMFLKNAITHDELRAEMGREPFEGDGWPTGSTVRQMARSKGDGDWSRTNYGLIERDKIVLQSLDEPGTPASKAESKSRITQNKSKSSGGNSVSNKNTPSNQHGKRSSAKLNRDSFGAHNTIPSLEVIFMNSAPLQNMYKDLRSDIAIQTSIRGFRMSEAQVLIDSAFGRAQERLIAMTQQSYRMGLRDAGVNVWDVRSDRADQKIHDHVSRYVSKLRKEVIRNLKRHTTQNPALRTQDAIFIDLVFGALRPRTQMIDNSEIMRGYNYGKASGHRVNGFDVIASSRHRDTPCNICDNHILIYNESDAIIYEDLAPLHPECCCTMEPKARNEI